MCQPSRWNVSRLVKWVRQGGALFGVLALFGCGSTGHDDAGATGGALAIRRAFSVASVNADELRVAHSALQNEISRCMEAEGFTYVHEDYQDAIAGIESPKDAVLITDSQASVGGYGVAAREVMR